MKHGPWQRPDYKADDIYPGFGCWDRMRAGGVNIGSTRLLAHDVIADVLRGGWKAAVSGYSPACSDQDYLRFLHDLLDVRGEFGRLLLTFAAAERAESEKDEAETDAHFAQVHPGDIVCDCGRGFPTAWWEDPDLSAPVVEQLRRCLAVLEAEP